MQDKSLRRGILYGYQKVDKGWNLQPTKTHINLLFIIFNISRKCYNIFQKKN
jgi:hypothetical protein